MATGSIDSPLARRVGAPVVKALATPLRKGALPPRGRYDEASHNRDHGRFSSSPGAGAAPKPSGPGKPAGQAGQPASPAPQQAEQRSRPAILQAFAQAGAAAGHLEEGVSAWIERQSQRLPPAVVAPVKGFLRAGFASYRAAQAAVDAVAKERGFSDEQRQKLGRIVSVVDLVGGGKLFPMALQAAGAGPMGSLAGGFVPVGSLGYLAYSTARDPAATWRAASGAVRARLGVAKSLSEGMDFDGLLSALASRPVTDGWFACFAEALDQTSGDVGQSLAVADEVAPSLPAETTKRLASPLRKSAPHDVKDEPRDDSGKWTSSGGGPSDTDLSQAKVSPVRADSAVHGNGNLLKVTAGDRSYFFKASSPTEASREVATAELAHLAGVNVPAARLATVSGKTGVLSAWTDAKPADADRGAFVAAVKADPIAASRLAAFHFLTGAEDRHGGNYLLSPQGGIQSIDHSDTLPARRSPSEAAELMGQDDLLDAMQKAQGGGDVRFDREAVAAVAGKTADMAAALRKRGMADAAASLEVRGRVLAALANDAAPSEAKLRALAAQTKSLRSPLRKSAADDEPRDDAGRWTAGGAHTDRHDRELSTRYDEGESDHADLGERAASHYAEHAVDHLFQASAPLGHQLSDFASVAADYSPEEAKEEASGWVADAKRQASGVLGLPERLAQTAEAVYQETPSTSTTRELTTALQGAYERFSTALEGDGTFTVEEMATGLAEGEDREEYESHADAFGDHLAKARDAFEGAVKSAVAAYWSKAASEAEESAARSIATPLRGKSFTAFIPGARAGTMPPFTISKRLPSPLRRPTL